MSWVWFKAFILKSEVLKIHDANMKQQNPVLFNYCNLKGFVLKFLSFFSQCFTLPWVSLTPLHYRMCYSTSKPENPRSLLGFCEVQ